jgi:hypothetical protein
MAILKDLQNWSKYDMFVTTRNMKPVPRRYISLSADVVAQSQVLRQRRCFERPGPSLSGGDVASKYYFQVIRLHRHNKLCYQLLYWNLAPNRTPGGSTSPSRDIIEWDSAVLQQSVPVFLGVCLSLKCLLSAVGQTLIRVSECDEHAIYSHLSSYVITNNRIPYKRPGFFRSREMHANLQE